MMEQQQCWTLLLILLLQILDTKCQTSSGVRSSSSSLTHFSFSSATAETRSSVGPNTSSAVVLGPSTSQSSALYTSSTLDSNMTDVASSVRSSSSSVHIKATQSLASGTFQSTTTVITTTSMKPSLSATRSLERTSSNPLVNSSTLISVEESSSYPKSTSKGSTAVSPSQSIFSSLTASEKNSESLATSASDSTSTTYATSIQGSLMSPSLSALGISTATSSLTTEGFSTAMSPGIDLASSAITVIMTSSTVLLTSSVKESSSVANSSTAINKVNSISTSYSSLSVSKNITSSMNMTISQISSIAASTSLSKATPSTSISSSSVKPPTPTPTTKTPATTKPTGPPEHCNEILNYCQNGGHCLNATGNNQARAYCVCAGDFYGDQCEKDLNAIREKPYSNLYKQLAYALGGTTIFLLLVLIILVLCRWKGCGRKEDIVSLKYSQELDDYAVNSQRASIVKQNPYVINAYDVYGGQENEADNL